MEIAVRRAAVEDIPLLVQMGKATFRETWEFMYDADLLNRYIDSVNTRETISAEISDPAFTHFLAFADEEAAGFAKLGRRQELGDWITGKCMELCRVYVYRKFHDLKIGKVLMQKCIELAHGEGFESLVLGVWENNHRAVKFYQRFGFEKIGEHPFHIMERVDTDWVMLKKL